jgi:hypothetical protein
MVAVATIMSFVCISTVDPTSPNLLRLLDGVDVEMASPAEALERLKGTRFEGVTVHLPLDQWDAENLLEELTGYRLRFRSSFVIPKEPWPMPSGLPS